MRADSKTFVSPRPHECVVLAIDPGATSGWAVLSPTGPHATGISSMPHMRAVAVQAARFKATSAALPVVAVMEKWTAHGAFGGARTQRGLGSEAGRWLEQIESAGIPKRRIIRVYPATWQGAILSAGGRGWTRERREAASIAYVKRRFGIVCGADEAASICIGVWAMHASETAAVLPRKRKERQDGDSEG